MDLMVDGHKVHVTTGGVAPDGAGPAVVLIHGAGLDRSVWSMQARYLAHKGIDTYVPDLPGHGHSDGEPIPDIPAMGDWIIRFMDAVGVEKAVIAGHSMGSLITLETAARHPERVSGIVMIGAAQTMPVHPDLLAAAEANDSLAHELITDWGFGSAPHIGGHPQPGTWVMGGGLATFANGPAGALANDLAACNAYDGLESAGRVKCPALFILGSEDKMTPLKSGRALAEAIAGAKVQVMSRTGHMLMAERPRDVAKLLAGFVLGSE